MREVLIEPLERPSKRAAARGHDEQLPPDFDEWFKRCVNRRPADRFQDAAECVNELNALVGAWLATGSQPMDLSSSHSLVVESRNSASSQVASRSDGTLTESSFDLEETARSDDDLVVSRPSPPLPIQQNNGKKLDQSGGDSFEEDAGSLLKTSRDAASLDEAPHATSQIPMSEAAAGSSSWSESEPDEEQAPASAAHGAGRNESPENLDAPKSASTNTTFHATSVTKDPDDASPDHETRAPSASKKVAALAATILIVLGTAYAFLRPGNEESPSSKRKGKPASTPQATARAKPIRSTKSTTKPASKPHLPTGMVKVPAGTYAVGCKASPSSNCFKDEGPVHKVKLKSFAIMTHEVRMLEYDECVANKSCPPPKKGAHCNWQRSGKEQHPINCVRHAGAAAFCKSKGWRLPTETEWEAAARGPEAHPNPWGKTEPSCALANMHGKGRAGCGSGHTAAVGSNSKDVSWVAAYDMGGNVREWTSSSYAAYPAGKAETDRKGMVNRGGSYLMKAEQWSASYTRGVDDPETHHRGLGFRCALSL